MHLVQKITSQAQPDYALIATDYFGGIGTQWAAVYRGEVLVDHTITRINPALRYLGAIAAPGQDEFDTVGLDRIRTAPEYLEKYVDLADELQV